MTLLLRFPHFVAHVAQTEPGFGMPQGILPTLFAAATSHPGQPEQTEHQFVLVLPLKAQAELNQAGVVCIADLAHRALIQPIFRQHEICVIEQVEELRAELHSLTLSDREILQNRKILVDEVRTN